MPGATGNPPVAFLQFQGKIEAIKICTGKPQLISTCHRHTGHAHVEDLDGVAVCDGYYLASKGGGMREERDEKEEGEYVSHWLFVALEAVFR